MVFFLVWFAAIGLTPTFLSFLALSNFYGPLERPVDYKCKGRVGMPPALFKALWFHFKNISGAELDCRMSESLHKEARKVIENRVALTSNGTLFWLPGQCQKWPPSRISFIARNMTSMYFYDVEDAVKRGGYKWIGFGGQCLNLDSRDRARYKTNKTMVYLLLVGARKPELAHYKS